MMNQRPAGKRSVFNPARVLGTAFNAITHVLNKSSSSKRLNNVANRSFTSSVQRSEKPTSSTTSSTSQESSEQPQKRARKSSYQSSDDPSKSILQGFSFGNSSSQDTNDEPKYRSRSIKSVLFGKSKKSRKSTELTSEDSTGSLTSNEVSDKSNGLSTNVSSEAIVVHDASFIETYEPVSNDENVPEASNEAIVMATLVDNTSLSVNEDGFCNTFDESSSNNNAVTTQPIVGKKRSFNASIGDITEDESFGIEFSVDTELCGQAHSNGLPDEIPNLVNTTHLASDVSAFNSWDDEDVTVESVQPIEEASLVITNESTMNVPNEVSKESFNEDFNENVVSKENIPVNENIVRNLFPSKSLAGSVLGGYVTNLDKSIKSVSTEAIVAKDLPPSYTEDISRKDTNHVVYSQISANKDRIFRDLRSPQSRRKATRG